MSQAKKGKLNFRCPSCFMRDIDMDMFFDESTGEYYCLRCCYHASEEEVLQHNEMAKYRYRMMKERVIDFNDDNKPLVTRKHKKGEQ